MSARHINLILSVSMQWLMCCLLVSSLSPHLLLGFGQMCRRGFFKDVVYLANEFVTTLEARIVTIIIFIPPCVLSYNVETMEGMRAFKAGENATLFCYIPLVGRRLIQGRKCGERNIDAGEIPESSPCKL